MNHKNNNRFLLVTLLRIVLILAMTYWFLLYNELKQISKEEKSVEYSIISAEEIKSGKSHYIMMQIKFQFKEYNVQVQPKYYYQSIKKNEKPILYYSTKRDVVFAQWSIKQYRAWVIVSLIALLISFVPFNRISKRMDEDIKRKDKERLRKSMGPALRLDRGRISNY